MSKNEKCADDSGSSRLGELFIVSAPSGAGKTTLIQGMMADGDPKLDNVDFSVSHTTRPPRAGEVDGRDYHFVSTEAFQEMIDEGLFLEWAKVHDHYYGTSSQEVLPRLAAGLDVVLDIDVQGAERILSLDSDEIPADRRHGIFVMPPGFEELRRRLERRNLDEPDEIQRRLRVALGEVQRYQQYEYVIINRSASRASKVLASIILEKRHRQERMRDHIACVLEDFSRIQQL